MENLAVEEIAHSRQPDMRMRPHIDTLPEQELRRSELIEEDERPDHLAACGRQGAAHAEAAEVLGGGHDHLVHGIAGKGVSRHGIIGWMVGHGCVPPVGR